MSGEDPDGPGVFELSAPRRESVEQYGARVPAVGHDEVLHEVVGRRLAVPERVAVEEIDEAAELLGACAVREQYDAPPPGHTGVSWAAGRARAQQRLDAAKARGREVLAGGPVPSGDRSTDDLIAHAREVLSRSAGRRSDAAAELERHDAVRRWAVDDEVALADADGVLDGWQW